MTKVIRATLLGLIGTTLVSCFPKQHTWSCPSLLTSNNTLSLNPDKIFIQIDGTPSMKGFVSNQNSRYIRTLRLLRSATGSAFPSTTSPSFYAFGTQRLKEPISHQEAETPVFYNGSRPELRDAAPSKIIKPQDSDSKDSLYVIVTDLYQEKAEWEDLAANLKDNYLLKEGYAVGIIAIKSDFRGTIYDVGLNKDKHSDITTNHPFYVLVLGKYSHIKKYFDEIKLGSENTGLNFTDENFVTFSSRLLEQPALLRMQETSLTSSQSKNLRRLKPGDLINDGKIVVNTDKNNLQNTELLLVSNQISNNSPKEVELEYSMNYKPLSYTLPLASSLRYRINKKSDFNQSTKDFKSLSDNNLSNIPLSLNNRQFQGNNEFKFNALINLKNNSQNAGIYRLIFDILPEEITNSTTPYKAPSWWKTWSFGEGEFAGDKTYNLQPFMYDLGNKTFRIIEDKPEFAVGRVCFIIHKK